MGLDIGPNACEQFGNVIKDPKRYSGMARWGFEMKLQAWNEIIAHSVSKHKMELFRWLVVEILWRPCMFGLADEVSYVDRRWCFA
jgi:hypothetical protein